MQSKTTSSSQRLRDYLNEARNNVLWKCEALSEQLARRPMTPTGTHMLGVVYHLAITEYGYFGQCLGRVPNDEQVLKALQSDNSQADFLPPADYSVQDILGLYRKSIAFSEQAINDLAFDTAAIVPWWTAHRHSTLEHLVVHMIAETSRHAGQLDVIRELLDGQVGLRAQATNIPGWSKAQWQAQYEDLQRLSDQCLEG